MQMQVIAEGVETRAQRDLLLKLGCRFGQGFLYSGAEPAEHWKDRTRHRPCRRTLNALSGCSMMPVPPAPR